MGVRESLNFRTYGTWGYLIGPKSAPNPPEFHGLRLTEGQICARPRLSDRGLKSEFLSKYAEPITSHGRFVGLFPDKIVHPVVVTGDTMVDWASYSDACLKTDIRT